MSPSFFTLDILRQPDNLRFIPDFGAEMFTLTHVCINHITVEKASHDNNTDNYHSHVGPPLQDLHFPLAIFIPLYHVFCINGKNLFYRSAGDFRFCYAVILCF